MFKNHFDLADSRVFQEFFETALNLFRNFASNVLLSLHSFDSSRSLISFSVSEFTSFVTGERLEELNLAVIENSSTPKAFKNNCYIMPNNVPRLSAISPMYRVLQMFSDNTLLIDLIALKFFFYLSEFDLSNHIFL